MVLDRLRVDTVLQHPTLVVVRAQTELALLVRAHCAVMHAAAPVGCHVSAALEGPLEPLGAPLVLALVDPLGGDLRLAGGPVLPVEALAAQGDAEGGLLLELEQAGLAVAHLSQANQSFLSSSNWASYPGRMASSSFSRENAKYMLSVSIWMSSKSRRSK